MGKVVGIHSVWSVNQAGQEIKLTFEQSIGMEEIDSIPGTEPEACDDVRICRDCLDMIWLKQDDQWIRLNESMLDMLATELRRVEVLMVDKADKARG